MTTRTLQTVAVARRRRRSGGFNVRRLFANGEAGGVYDPSDLTAEKVAWRRNLLTWSEDFANAAWTKTNVTVTANAAIAPDGTLTADKMVSAVGTSSQRVSQSFVAQGAGAPFTQSCYVKADGASWFMMRVEQDNADPVWFDATNGTVGSVTGRWSNATIENVGNGWYRCAARYATVGTTYTCRLFLANTNGDTTYTGNGSNGLLLWGAQTNNGIDTAYQRITDFTSDFLAAFPTHGLYQDSAGTTPVTALGQPVGLVIDSKTGGLANLGPDAATGAWQNAWTTPFDTFTSTVSDGFTGTTTAARTGVRVRVPTTLVSGKSYAVEFTLTYTSATTLTTLNFSNTAYSGEVVIQSSPTALNSVKYRAIGTANANSAGVMLLFTTSAATTVTLSGFTVREVPGVHAIQPTNSSRPLLDGRVNLLTFSEQFDNAAWNKGTGGSISANSVMAPDGTMTADAYTWATSTLQFGFLSQSVSGAPQVAHQYTIYLKVPAGIGSKQLRLRMSDVTTSTADSSNVTVTESWQAFTFTRTSANATGQVGVALNVASGGPANGIAAGDVLHVWGADLRLAADAAYPYQRVAAATDYADVGVPRSFAFDGFDDSLYTASNMDLSGTDKVMVLAGVRKLSDAAAQLIAETSANASTNVGTLSVSNFNRAGSVNARYSFASAGTLSPLDIRYAVTPDNYAAPNTAVLTGLGNISGDSAIIRANGVQQDQNTGDQGVTNYGSYVLFIGRRNNASLPFNGKAYQLIVRGALTDAATLAQAERYVGAKTGIFL